jgi:hypothetical protein
VLDPSWHTAAKGTVALSLPLTVSLRDDHVLVVGQQASPGKHLQSVSRFSHSARENEAKKARERSPAFEENIMAKMGELVSTGKQYSRRRPFCIRIERKDSGPTHAYLIAQIGSEEIICEYGDPFTAMSL